MSDEVRQFIRENREIAATQAQRWQGVDPSRLIQALDYLERAVGEASPPTAGAELLITQLSIEQDIHFGTCVSVEARGYLDGELVKRVVEHIRGSGLTKGRFLL